MVDFWKLDKDYAFYVDIEHNAIHQSIRRYKKWSVMAEYSKNGKLLGVQYRVPIKEYEKGWRLFNRTTNPKESCD